MAARQHTLREAADELGLPLSTVAEWATLDGAPFNKPGKGKPSRCDPAEIAAWAASRNLTGKPGRPRADGGEDIDSDYWLGRYRKAKALREERSVIPKAEHERLISGLAAAAAAKIRELPAAIAPSLHGLTAQEIEAELESKVGDICDYLSDPGNYELRDEGD